MLHAAVDHVDLGGIMFTAKKLWMVQKSGEKNSWGNGSLSTII